MIEAQQLRQSASVDLVVLVAFRTVKTPELF